MSSALGKCMHMDQYTHSDTHMDKMKKSDAERAGTAGEGRRGVSEKDGEKDGEKRGE